MDDTTWERKARFRSLHWLTEDPLLGERRDWVLACILAAVLAGAAVWMLKPAPAATSTEVTRLLVSVTPADQLRASPADQTLGEGQVSRTAMVVSPDGRTRGPISLRLARLSNNLLATRRPDNKSVVVGSG